MSASVVQAPQQESSMIPRTADIETQLREQYGDGAIHQIKQVIEELAVHFKLTPDELAESDGSHRRFPHKVHTATAHHSGLGLLVRLKRGYFRYDPEKLAEYKPRHHPPRVHKPGNPHHLEAVAKAIRSLKRKRHALTLAIRELEEQSS
jgi:restriction endonuclease Mrr